MLRRVIGVLVSGALIGPVVIHAQGAAPKNRDDDTLLLIVGRSQLQDHPEFTCVMYFEEQWKEKPVSDWLLNRLRRYRPGLVKCDDNMASDNALLLGPIEWTPSKVATVKFGVAAETSVSTERLVSRLGSLVVTTASVAALLVALPKELLTKTE